MGCSSTRSIILIIMKACSRVTVLYFCAKSHKYMFFNVVCLCPRQCYWVFSCFVHENHTGHICVACLTVWNRAIPGFHFLSSYKDQQLESKGDKNNCFWRAEGMCFVTTAADLWEWTSTLVRDFSMRNSRGVLLPLTTFSMRMEAEAARRLWDGCRILL